MVGLQFFCGPLCFLAGTIKDVRYATLLILYAWFVKKNCCFGPLFWRYFGAKHAADRKNAVLGETPCHYKSSSWNVKHLDIARGNTPKGVFHSLTKAAETGNLAC